MKRAIYIFIVSLVVLSLFGCSTTTDKTDQNKLIVAVSIVPEQTFVQAVAGDLVEVITMIPSGSSPETYEPTPLEMEKFSDADVYFAIGVPAEETNILPNAQGMNIVMLNEEVAKTYPTLMLGDEADPHIWLSIKRVKLMITLIADELGRLDPDNQATYQQNAEAYIASLDDTDVMIRDLLANDVGSKFIVYHPAFGYFANEYGLEMFSLEEEGKEATPQHLQEMIDLAKSENIKVIFYQSEIDSSQSEAYAEEVNGIATQLEPLSGDYINNLIKMASTISEALSEE